MRPLNILVADDSHTVRVHIERRLRREGFEVATAHDGIEAVELIRADPPDLAVLDINMPRLDGYGVCQEIRAMDICIPVVFLTAVRANAVRMLGEKMGAYLTKPVCGDRLVEVVRRVVASSTGVSSHPTAPGRRPSSTLGPAKLTGHDTRDGRA